MHKAAVKRGFLTVAPGFRVVAGRLLSDNPLCFELVGAGLLWWALPNHAPPAAILSRHHRYSRCRRRALARRTPRGGVFLDSWTKPISRRIVLRCPPCLTPKAPNSCLRNAFAAKTTMPRPRDGKPVPVEDIQSLQAPGSATLVRTWS